MLSYTMRCGAALTDVLYVERRSGTAVTDLSSAAVRCGIASSGFALRNDIPYEYIWNYDS